MEEIRFYRSNEEPYGFLSNLYKRELWFENLLFNTAEHAYQYGKPRKKRVRDWLMAAPSPSLLAMAAHGLYSWDIVSGWSSEKLTRMGYVVVAKFTQQEDLGQALLNTGDALLIESPTVDSSTNRFWGEVNGKGKNMLGQLLMGLRKDLKSGKYDELITKWEKAP